MGPGRRLLYLLASRLDIRRSRRPGRPAHEPWLTRPFSFGVFVGPVVGSPLMDDWVGQQTGTLAGLRLGWDLDDDWGLEMRLATANIPIYDSPAAIDAQLRSLNSLPENDPQPVYHRRHAQRRSLPLGHRLSLLSLGRSLFPPLPAFRLGHRPHQIHRPAGERVRPHSLGHTRGPGHENALKRLDDFPRRIHRQHRLGRREHFPNATQRVVYRRIRSPLRPPAHPLLALEPGTIGFRVRGSGFGIQVDRLLDPLRGHRELE